MKTISNIFKTLGVGAVVLSMALTSCEDMLDPESDLVMYERDNQISSVHDTLYSVMGVVHLMQKVADRTNILGEVRSDLVKVTADASVDLQDLANFTADVDNAYNKPQDYYAIVNSCNYYVEHADSTYKKQGVKVFERELAAIHSFRAWAYLQLALNYGSVPFYTEFLGTQEDAESVMRQPRKSLKEICTWLIDDLKPWATTPALSYGSMAEMNSKQFFIPVRLMLAELCLWSDRYLEAATYYHSYLADRDYPLPLYPGRVHWMEDDRPAKRVGDGYSAIREMIAYVPMQTNIFDGTISYLSDLYCSTENNDFYYELTYSQSAIEQSAAQAYYYVYEESGKRDTVCMSVDTLVAKETDVLRLGDLRLYSNVMYGYTESSVTDKYNKLYQQIYKFVDDRVVLYRNTVVYLHFAEALNRAGFPTAAFAVLKYGLCDDNLERADGNPILESERLAAGDLLDFSSLYFTRDNTIGIHSMGSGDADANPEYVIPSLVSANDTMLWVEDKIVEELSLETVFEGHRFYDLMRVAKRRGDVSYLANRIMLRDGVANPDTELGGRLQNESNWYLPLK